MHSMRRYRLIAAGRRARRAAASVSAVIRGGSTQTCSTFGCQCRSVVGCTVESCRSTGQTDTQTDGWRRGVVVSAVSRMNEVNARRVRLVLEWVTVFGRIYHLEM